MGSRIQTIAIVASILIILFIVSLIRKRKLREEYSIMWIIGSLVLIAFSIRRDLLDKVANMVGVFYAPVVLLLVGVFFGILIFLHLTVMISKQTEQNRTLVQEIALLKHRIERYEANSKS